MEAIEKAEQTSDFLDAKIEAANAMYKATDDFELKRSMSVLVCGEEMNLATSLAMQELRAAKSKISKGEGFYADYRLELASSVPKVFASARRELGIVDEDNGIL